MAGGRTPIRQKFRRVAPRTVLAASLGLASLALPAAAGAQVATGPTREEINRGQLDRQLRTEGQAVVVEETDAAGRRDNGFTQTLTQEEIDSLPDDPDEMAEELMRMAGPGAQIFVNGFRGGRMPPKDQIQQIRFHTNSFSAEYHEAGMSSAEEALKSVRQVPRRVRSAA